MHNKLITGSSYNDEAKYIILPFEIMAEYTIIITTIWGVFIVYKIVLLEPHHGSVRKVSPPCASEEETKAHQKGYRNKELQANEREKRGRKEKVLERPGQLPMWQAQ